MQCCRLKCDWNGLHLKWTFCNIEKCCITPLWNWTSSIIFETYRKCSFLCVIRNLAVQRGVEIFFVLDAIESIGCSHNTHTSTENSSKHWGVTVMERISLTRSISRSIPVDSFWQYRWRVQHLLLQIALIKRDTMYERPHFLRIDQHFEACTHLNFATQQKVAIVPVHAFSRALTTNSLWRKCSFRWRLWDKRPGSFALTTQPETGWWRRNTRPRN